MIFGDGACPLEHEIRPPGNRKSNIPLTKNQHLTWFGRFFTVLISDTLWGSLRSYYHLSSKALWRISHPSPHSFSEYVLICKIVFSKFVDKDNDIELTQHLREKNKFCHTYFAPVLFDTYRVSWATMQANTTADFAFFSLSASVAPWLTWEGESLPLLTMIAHFSGFIVGRPLILRKCKSSWTIWNKRKDAMIVGT